MASESYCPVINVNPSPGPLGRGITTYFSPIIWAILPDLLLYHIYPTIWNIEPAQSDNAFACIATNSTNSSSFSCTAIYLACHLGIISHKQALDLPRRTMRYLVYQHGSRATLKRWTLVYKPVFGFDGIGGGSLWKKSMPCSVALPSS